MTNVTTHLFYGLFVTTTSLIIASRAFTKVQGPLLAINLILNRKSASTLQISTSSNSLSASKLTRLPVEVWEMIRRELIGIELAEEEKEFVSLHLCDCCKGRCEDSRCDMELKSLPVTWKSFARDCDNCINFFTESQPWHEIGTQFQASRNPIFG